ncbi:hypothetical protein PJM25_17420 [Mycobacterium kansasii]
MAAKLPPAGVVRIVETVRHHLGRLHRGLVPAPVALMEMILQAWAAQAITVARGPRYRRRARQWADDRR